MYSFLFQNKITIYNSKSVNKNRFIIGTGFAKTYWVSTSDTLHFEKDNVLFHPRAVEQK